jgi:hypothetical protein
MTCSSPAPTRDHDALTASLRTWVIAFVAWLAEALGAHTLTRSMRGWVHVQLRAAEKGVAALIVFAAMRLLPTPPMALHQRRGARPLAGPRGFARVRIHTNDMRGVLRALFPRQRDIVRRSVRLMRVLQAARGWAQRMARRIRRILPGTRLTAIRPPAAPVAPVVDACAPAAPDSS